MKTKFLFTMSIAAALLSFSACSDKDDINDINDSELSSQNADKEIVLGKKEESPLLLKNMQRAIDTLAARSCLKSSVTLSPTHYYVRFLPKDSAEYERIKADTSLVLTSYPLDYELSEGDSYHDPSIPADDITWQYTVVPVDYDLEGMNVKYEKLDDLFIQSENLESDSLVETDNSELKSTHSPAAKITWRQLVNEAITQTTGEQPQLKSSWTPQATIKAYDDLLNDYVPLQGVKVRIRYFAFLFAHHFTDANGHVSFSSKRTKVEYSIVWESDKWDIRHNWIQAYYDGPHKKSAWNFNINSDNLKTLHYSAIHRGLFKYYYGNALGLSRPSKNVKIAYHATSNTSIAGTTHQSSSFLSSPIEIWQKDGNSIHNVSFIISTTFHELTHFSYNCRVSENDYTNTTKIIMESWSTFAQWLLMRDLYPVDYTSKIDEDYSKSNWIYVSDLDLKDYTPLFIDMVDDYNQHKDNIELPNDEISGYSIESLDDNIINFRNLKNVEKYMKNNKPDGITDEIIDKYLESYKECM